MKKIALLLTLAIAMFTLAACSSSAKDDTSKKENSNNEAKTEKKTEPKLVQLDDKVEKGQPVATIETTEGTVKIKLFPKEAPKAVENFVTHAKDGYYDGLLFHRVIDNFMIQSGDPKGDGTGGESIWKKPFKNEISNNLYHFRGALAMANAGPDTNGSQFYIVQNKFLTAAEIKNDSIQYTDSVKEAYEKLKGVPSLDGSYTVFGQTIEGLDIVDKIAETEVGANDKPEKDIKIKTIKITE
ncbi:MAG: peptidylprolyl isomerase [Brochothrix thermosphacta]|uniref:peptidylprolyl isomerase n=1 Tax=Brochothrix thermosphacta TaxID=2756 RepID=UPI00083FCD07|nr:peptidylprolyl isomerase [Brochothrix thermosphacta]ANZ97616.1 peptidylprolyl isomerase [Brochothrix thermosphacta]ODJ60185.1 peptidylprolyl isomerase [Brochothrix thermosphacta]SPP28002.1 putative peptidyl-prolyl cis-trans isomerase [Brochothrix thermosphacta]HCZ39852.1 peptidylprolyl isomerase [Brochothrix thermosphacta]HCZ46391.1 peptidylprolyl isomerase [Brochothrix thermosphacta]